MRNNKLSFRDRLMIRLVEDSKPFYLKHFKAHRQSWKLQTKDLEFFPANSLAFKLNQFLNDNNIRLIPKMESHDVFHVVLGYSASVPEECCMQYCLLGNGKRSLYVLGTCLIAALFYPDYFLEFHKAYLKGKKAISFFNWDFEALLSCPTDRIRAAIFKGEYLPEIVVLV